MVLYDNDYYESHDLALVAALAEYGFTPLQLDRSNPKRVVFIFEHSEELRSLIDEYWLNQLKVNPKTYFDSLKHLKTRLYSRN